MEAKTFQGLCPESQSGSPTRPGDFRELHGGPPGGVRPETRQNQGCHPGLAKQAEAQPEAAPGTWRGRGWGRLQNQQWPPSALLLTPPGGHRILPGAARCQIMGWEGSTSLYLGTEQCCPAQPGPQQTAKHNGSLRQADNSALSGRGHPGWHPLPLCFSLAPVSESLKLMTLGTMNGEQV